MKEPFNKKKTTLDKLFDTFEGELNKLSVEHNVPVREIKYIIEDFFTRFKTWITHPTMPTILISNLGTFKPSYSQIGRSLTKSIKWYKLGRTKADNLRIKIKSLWPIRKRLQKEKKGIITWKEWRKIKSDVDKGILDQQLRPRTENNT